MLCDDVAQFWAEKNCNCAWRDDFEGSISLVFVNGKVKAHTLLKMEISLTVDLLISSKDKQKYV